MPPRDDAVGARVGDDPQIAEGGEATGPGQRVGGHEFSPILIAGTDVRLCANGTGMRVGSIGHMGAHQSIRDAADRHDGIIVQGPSKSTPQSGRRCHR